MTKIFYSYISKKDHYRLLHDFLPCFSTDMQTAILKFRRWEDVQLSLLGKLLLRYGLEEMGVRFSEKKLYYNAHNKPYLNGENTKFNISHSGEMVVCAITNSCEIGIDIEVLNDIDFYIFRPQMLRNEWKRIFFAEDLKTAFFDYWTQKEAVMKAHGMGLSIPLKSFEVTDLHSVIHTKEFFLKEIKLDYDYKCYLAFTDHVQMDTIESVRIDFSSFLPIVENSLDSLVMS